MNTNQNEVIYDSNTTGKFRIIWKQGKNCIVQFIETGYTRKALTDNVFAGKVLDHYAKTSYGRGYLGEPAYPRPVYWKQAAQLWRNMMKRCYSEKDKKGYFKHGTTVDDRWLCFENFISDIRKLENFDLWLKGQKDGAIKYNLDKDYKYPSNNVYSKECCMFLDEHTNKSMGARWKRPRVK